ncbi:hypothetical protein PCL_01832 [Purpureocillium lilacinum]|uniref:Uncharacterized protein n=2 Tax=Purpureocillium lilacinum TaxID=33203 RepID=A0A2U3E2K7_PURLI|nr:hypothetical protein Purlil1_401 [Purpureocillium lilacinum]PWI68743.1 hypothetical protein PCL_01832 [Purpureocillium lilacinum]
MPSSDRKSGDHGHRDSPRYNSISNNPDTFVGRMAPPDPRPSRADPHHRSHRKSKEKESGGFDWGEGIALALIGATALFSIDRHLEKKRNK